MDSKKTTKKLIFDDEKSRIRIGVSKADEKAKDVSSKRRVNAPLSVEEKSYFTTSKG